MVYDHTLYFPLDECGRCRHQTQLLPALSDLLLHFFIISRLTCTLNQLHARSPSTQSRSQICIAQHCTPQTIVIPLRPGWFDSRHMLLSTKAKKCWCKNKIAHRFRTCCTSKCCCSTSSGLSHVWNKTLNRFELKSKLAV